MKMDCNIFRHLLAKYCSVLAEFLVNTSGALCLQKSTNNKVKGN